jgi:hypothetical protein
MRRFLDIDGRGAGNVRSNKDGNGNVCRNVG